MKILGSASTDGGTWKTASLVLAAALSLLASGCGGGTEESGGTSPGSSPSPGTEGLLDGPMAPPGAPGDGGTEPGPGQDPGEPPAPGEPTSAEFEIAARGTEPVEDRYTPAVLLARTAQEGAAAADASPAPGAAAVLRDWDDYDRRALVAVLGGSQPDAAHRLRVRAVNVVRNGTLLLASGKIVRLEGPAAQVISIPWMVLALDPQATDTLERCTVSLEGATPFTTACG